jgi:uncharacterized membrane protein (DUF485 family)
MTFKLAMFFLVIYVTFVTTAIFAARFFASVVRKRGRTKNNRQVRLSSRGW